MPKRTDISKILILGSGPSVREVLKGRAFKARRKGRRKNCGFRWDETAGLAERAMLLSATHSRCKKETSQ